MTFTPEDVKVVITAIYNKQYYVSLWEKVKHKKPLEQCSQEELLLPFQLFWDFLPDTPDIQRAPFYQVCDLAEHWCTTSFQSN